MIDQQPTQPKPPHARLLPKRIMLSAWLVAIVASLLFADDIHRISVKRNRFQASPSWLQRTTDSLRSASLWLGMSQLGQKLQILPNPLDTHTSRQLAAQLLSQRSRVQPPQLRGPRSVRKRPQQRPDQRRGAPSFVDGRITRAPLVKKILMIGASSMFRHPGTRTERRLKRHYLGLTIHRLGKVSSSLTRPDYYDWPATLKLLMKSFQPDMVLANFGYNDIQAMPYKKRGRTRYVRFINDLWREKYLAILRPFLDTMQSGGAHITWLGYARMPIASHTKALSIMHSLYRKELRERHATFLSWWRISRDPNGRRPIREQVTYKGETGPSRTKDGLHFSVLGASFMAEHLCRQLERHYYLIPKDTSLAPVRQVVWHDTLPFKMTRKPTDNTKEQKAPKQAPKARKKSPGQKLPKQRTTPKQPDTSKTPILASTLHALTYIPRTLQASSKSEKPRRYPALFLHFSGPQARYAPIEAHLLLQKFAQAQKVAIVVPIDPTLDSGGEPLPLPPPNRLKQQLPRLASHLPLSPQRRFVVYPMALSRRRKTVHWKRWRKRLRMALTQEIIALKKTKNRKK